MTSVMRPTLKPVSGNQGYAKIGGVMSRTEAKKLEKDVKDHRADQKTEKKLEQQIIEAQADKVKAQQGQKEARKMKKVAAKQMEKGCKIEKKAKEHLVKSKQCQVEIQVVDQQIQSNNALIITNFLSTLSKIEAALNSTTNNTILMLEVKELTKRAKVYDKENTNGNDVTVQLKTLNGDIQNLALKLRDLILANKAKQ